MSRGDLGENGIDWELDPRDRFPGLRDAPDRAQFDLSAIGTARLN
jgi:hypothetical protein